MLFKSRTTAKKNDYKHTYRDSAQRKTMKITKNGVKLLKTFVLPRLHFPLSFLLKKYFDRTKNEKKNGFSSRGDEKGNWSNVFMKRQKINQKTK